MAHALRPNSSSSAQSYPTVLRRNDRVSLQAKIISLIAVNVLVAFVSFIYLPWQAALGVTLATSFILALINGSPTAPASAVRSSSQVAFSFPQSQPAAVLPQAPLSNVPARLLPASINPRTGIVSQPVVDGRRRENVGTGVSSRSHSHRPAAPASYAPAVFSEGPSPFQPLSNVPERLPPASANPLTGVISQPVVDGRPRENVGTTVSSRSHSHRSAPPPSYAPAAFPSVAPAPAAARPAQSTIAQLPREPVGRPRAITTSSSPQGGSIALNRGEERRRGNREGSASLFARAYSLPEESDTDSPAPPQYHAQFPSQDFQAATNQTPTGPSAPPLPKKPTREPVGQRQDTR